VAPSEDFDGGDRVLFEECEFKPDDLFLLRVESMAAKTKIRHNCGSTVDFAGSNKFCPNGLSPRF
jgi:hypothetical protein